MWNFLHKLASPPYFYNLSGRLIPWFGWPCLILLLVGLYWGLIVAPTDYQQGDSYRIMYIHVPAAWMSMSIYVVMAITGAIGLIWKIKLADVIVATSAPVGAAFTFLTLLTGALWGKPTWGTWWVWDARLTSELILLFLYFGIIALNEAVEDKRTAGRACAILALVGVVNIPIIHFSVEWWNTLHQPNAVLASLASDKPPIHVSMLMPMLIMAIAFNFYYAMTVLMRARCEVLERERNSNWVRALLQEQRNS